MKTTTLLVSFYFYLSLIKLIYILNFYKRRTKHIINPTSHWYSIRVNSNVSINENVIFTQSYISFEQIPFDNTMMLIKEHCSSRMTQLIMIKCNYEPTVLINYQMVKILDNFILFRKFILKCMLIFMSHIGFIGLMKCK